MKIRIILVMALSLILASTAAFAIKLSIEEKIGRHLYQDKSLSWNETQSCATCHNRSAGFADPTNNRDPEDTMASLGDDGYSRGGRNAPTSAYCGYSPTLAQNTDGEWIGGMFWDGRAQGNILGDPLAEQAQGPPLNPVEMNMPSVEAIVARVESSDYAPLLISYFDDPNFFSDPDSAYDDMARMIAAYERSAELNRFNSRFDRGDLSDDEQRGLQAFKKAECDACHSLEIPEGVPGPLFTNYGYANIGIPMNVLVNTETDLGLGNVVGYEQNGKFKIQTLRNVAKTAPYSHNGYFATLKEMVRFHLDRGGLEADVEENLVDPVAVELNEQEINDIIAFLNTLTDEGV